MTPPGFVTRTISAAVRPVVVDVLDDLVREDEVEVIVRIGQGLADADHDVGQLGAGLGHPLRLDLDAVDVIGEVAEAAHVGADAAADVEDRGALEVDEPAHHLQAAVLAVAPRVAGPPALDRGAGGLLAEVGRHACATVRHGTVRVRLARRRPADRPRAR